MNGKQRLITCVALFLATVTAVRGYTYPVGVGDKGMCEKGDVGKTFCMNCMATVKCYKADDAPGTPILCKQDGEKPVCEELGDTAICVPLADSRCSCDGPTQCDAFDSNSVLNCGLQTPINVVHCNADEVCSNVTNQCEVGATTTTLDPSKQCADEDNGWVMAPTDCSTGVYCDGSGVSLGTYPCSENEYFDQGSATCALAPPVPCAGVDFGPSPDLGNCSQFFVCENEKVLEKTECEGTKVYDPEADACVNDNHDLANLPCRALEQCGFSSGATTPAVSTTTTGATTPSVSTTTTGATTPAVDQKPDECSASAVGIYPDPENCKRYWTCKNIEGTGYLFIHGTCHGTLVYNPATTICGYPEDVPAWDCMPPHKGVY